MIPKRKHNQQEETTMELLVIEGRVAANTYRAMVYAKHEGALFVVCQRAVTKGTRDEIAPQNLALARVEAVNLMRGREFRSFLQDNLNLAWEPLMRSSGRSIETAANALIADAGSSAMTELAEAMAKMPTGLSENVLTATTTAIASQIAANRGLKWSAKKGFYGDNSTAYQMLEIREVTYGKNKIKVLALQSDDLSDIYCEVEATEHNAPTSESSDEVDQDCTDNSDYDAETSEDESEKTTADPDDIPFVE